MASKRKSSSDGAVPGTPPAGQLQARASAGDEPRLNWKGRLSERTVEAAHRYYRRKLGLLDEFLGTTPIYQSNLNWKGRLIERTVGAARWRFARLMGRLDEFLGTTHVYHSNLNWKGRLIERTVGAARWRFALWMGRLDERLGTTHVNNAGLNWKGRNVERVLGIGRSIRWRLTRVVHVGLFAAIDRPCFFCYLVLRRLRKRHTVRSVLHLSILSHKPLMISRVQREEGLKADFFALNADIASPVLNLGSDYSLPFKIGPWKRRFLESYYLWTVVARYDVLHSHFKSLLSHTGWELDLLKRLGTVIVFHFRGCDLRYRTLNMQLFPDINICAECDYPVGSCDTDYQRRQVGITRRAGDLFFVTTPDLEGFLPDAVHVPFIHPIGIDFDSIVAAPRTPGVFRVVTSSNHPGIDGTRFVQDAVARLHREGYAIELLEVADVPYRQALAIYKSADAFVGKLRMGYYNNANIETMMLGVPNFSYVREEWLPRIPDCPIIVTTPDTVYQQLKIYIDRPDELRAIGARGPEFVRRHHDPRTIARYMIQRYNDVLEARAAGKPASMSLDASGPATVPLLRADLSRVEQKRS